MKQDAVIILHGIFRSSRSMNGLARYLRKAGFRILNVGYSSTKKSISEIIDVIHPTIEHFIKDVPGKVHLVGYSMGGLVARAYLNRYSIPSLGRVVLIGTPNHGSEVADFVKDWWLYKRLYGPAGQQLLTNKHQSLHNLLGKVSYEVGVIAGNHCWDPVCSFLIGKENDGKVSVESTKLDGMKEHVILPVGHVYMPHSRKIWKLTCRFLEHGSFSLA